MALFCVRLADLGQARAYSLDFFLELRCGPGGCRVINGFGRCVVWKPHLFEVFYVLSVGADNTCHDNDPLGSFQYSSLLLIMSDRFGGELLHVEN